MPRRPRVFVEGGIYHVYNRFARGTELFAEPVKGIRTSFRAATVERGLQMTDFSPGQDCTVL